MVSEKELQIGVAAALRTRMVRFRDLLAIHVPNEGKRSSRRGAELRKEGMVSGAPDLVVWLHRWYVDAGWPSVVAIELKAETGTVSKNQADFAGRLGELGHPWHVVKAGTVEGAVSAVLALLPPPPAGLLGAYGRARL
jgi:hypothetical protein